MSFSNFLQWNCRGIKPNFCEFRLLCDQYDPILCCIQETFFSSTDFNIRGFNSYHYTSQDIGVFPPTYITNNLQLFNSTPPYIWIISLGIKL